MISNATLMCHAPIVIPSLAGARADACRQTTVAMRQAARALISDEPQLVVVLTPHGERRRGEWGISHHTALHGDLARFGRPDLRVRFNGAPNIARRLSEGATSAGLSCWELSDAGCDHGAFVPLHFVAEAGYTGQVLLISLPWPGTSELERFGQVMAECFDAQTRVAILASGDMSHRLIADAPAGFHPRAKQFDEQFVAALKRGDYRAACTPDPALQDLAAEDVVDSVTVAVAAAEYRNRGHEVLCYEGPFGVGYAEAVLFNAGAPPRALVGLAREAIAAWLENRRPERPVLEAAWEKPRATFITLRKPNGDLRGCIGSLVPSGDSLIDEIIANAVGAASRDPRFAPVTAQELPALGVEVSVLDEPEPIGGPDQLDPSRYGVVVSHLGRSGVLLPEIDGIERAEDQVSIAMRKANIAPGTEVELKRFRVRKVTSQPP